MRLSRRFQGVRALEDLTLQVPMGVIFGFLGPNGAGKTTTIRLLLGLLEPTAGEASVLGFDVRTQSHVIRENVGVLLEGDGLYSRLTALENLLYYGEINGLPRERLRARIRELLERLGLWDRRNDRAGAFSKGMKRKLALARALLPRPSLLFLDEPTTGLDAVSAVALREDLSNLVRQEGVTVFLTTHNLLEAEKICDRVGVIHRGRLVAEGRPDEVSARTRGHSLEVVGRGFGPEVLEKLAELPKVSEVVGTEHGLVIHLKEWGDQSDVIRLVASGDAVIEEVKKTGATLEEAFIELLGEDER